MFLSVLCDLGGCYTTCPCYSKVYDFLSTTICRGKGCSSPVWVSCRITTKDCVGVIPSTSSPIHSCRRTWVSCSEVLVISLDKSCSCYSSPRYPHYIRGRGTSCIPCSCYDTDVIRTWECRSEVELLNRIDSSPCYGVVGVCY